MAQQLMNHTWFCRPLARVVAGTTDQTSTVVDMRGFESAYINVALGAITAGAITSVQVQTGALADGSDMTNYGVALSIRDNQDNGVILIDLVKPQTRYFRVVVHRSTQNAEIDGVFVQLYNLRVQHRQDQDLCVAASGMFFTPAAAY